MWIKLFKQSFYLFFFRIHFDELVAFRLFPIDFKTFMEQLFVIRSVIFEHRLVEVPSFLLSYLTSQREWLRPW